MGTGVTPKRIATGNTIWPFYRTNNLHLVLRASCPTSNPLCFFSVDPSLHMSHSCFKWFSKQVCFLIFTVLSRAQSLMTKQQTTTLTFFLRKEVIQPHLPIRLPCYDFTPVIGPAFGSSLLSVGSLTSGVTDSHGVTGGVYKTRERIHRSILICDY